MAKLGEGIITPLITPINEDETVNYEQLGSLVDYVIQGGVDAIFSMGSTGEFARFSSAVRGEVIRATVKAAGGRVPIYAGVGDTGLVRVKDNIRRAEEAGADVIVITLPYYYPIKDDEEAYSFFRDVLTYTRLPVMLYNIPSTCGASISQAVIDRLLHFDNLIGIKDSSGDWQTLCGLLDRYKNQKRNFAVVVGAENLSQKGLLGGADGLVPSLSNPFPKLLAGIYKAAVDRDGARLGELCGVMDRMNELNTYCGAWMSPNVWRKRALAHLGICNDYCTKPFVEVDGETDKRVLDAVNCYKEMYA